MNPTDTSSSINRYSYRIDYRYKKFDGGLQASDFTNSTLTITVDEPIPDLMQRSWTKIVGEINPHYFKIEIVDVKNI